MAQAELPRAQVTREPERLVDYKRNAINPGDFNGDERKFVTWRWKFEGFIGAQLLEHIIKHSPLAYGFVATNPGGTYVDPFEPDDATKSTVSYKHGSNFVFQQLKSLLASGSAFQLIRTYEATCDGRMAWITLCRFYESAGVTSTAKIEAHNTIMNLTYGGASRKTGTFTDYVSKHIGAAAPP